MYSSMSASLTAPRPIARRAEKPVPMPKSMRPGASPFNVANAFAVDRRDAVRRHQEPRAEPDARGLERRRSHRDKALAGDHLRVEEPGMGKAEFLGPLGQFPGVARGRDAD